MEIGGGNISVRNQHLPTFRGRSLGIATLSVLQLLIGGIHVVFGFWLLTASQTTSAFFDLEASAIYSIYTIAFGFGATILAYGIWLQKNWGAFGTITLSFFVIIVDSLAVLDLPTIPGVPKFAALTEILYSVVIASYLIQLKIHWKKEP